MWLPQTFVITTAFRNNSQCVDVAVVAAPSTREAHKRSGSLFANIDVEGSVQTRRSPRVQDHIPSLVLCINQYWMHLSGGMGSATIIANTDDEETWPDCGCMSCSRVVFSRNLGRGRQSRPTRCRTQSRAKARSSNKTRDNISRHYYRNLLHHSNTSFEVGIRVRYRMGAMPRMLR